MGGMDGAVKDYFFNLPPLELSSVLNDYERAYGRPAREWAAKTIPKWRTSRVQMGGMVAERLFNLLPPRMPLAAKYKLVEGLWHHVGPSSKHRITVGADAKVAQVIELARSTIMEFVVDYKMSADLERRFNWLAGGDVMVKQMLLGHVQEIEKTIAVEAVRAQLPVMLSHLKAAGSHTGRLAQIVHVGKHELEIVMGKITATEINITTPPRTIFWGTNTCHDTVLICLIMIMGCIILAITIATGV